MKIRMLPIVLCAAGVQLWAQQPEVKQPPKVVRIYREEIKPGRGAAHEKTEAGYVRAFNKYKFPVHYVAMTSMSGPNEAWFAEAHDSFEALAQADQQIEKSPLKSELDMLDAQDGELRASNRTVLARYRPDLSYRPEQAHAMLPKSRYVQVETFRVRFGKGFDFEQLAKTAIAASEKSNSDMPNMVYEVASGMPAGTYLIFAPMQSLRSVDGERERGKAWFDAMGDQRDQFIKTATETIMAIERNFFQLSPKMSYVPEEFASADPSFWKPVMEPAQQKTNAKVKGKKNAPMTN